MLEGLQTLLQIKSPCGGTPKFKCLEALPQGKLYPSGGRGLQGNIHRPPRYEQSRGVEHVMHGAISGLLLCHMSARPGGTGLQGTDERARYCSMSISQQAGVLLPKPRFHSSNKTKREWPKGVKRLYRIRRQAYAPGILRLRCRA